MYRWIPFAVASALLLGSAEQAESQQDPAVLGQGAQVYLASCGRCHNARPASERTDKEWMAIVTHMRARANMSKSDASAVLAFLQATNAPENPARSGGAPPDAEAPPFAATRGNER